MQPTPPSPRLAGADRPSRVVIDRILPAIDGGRFAIKRTVGDSLAVTAYLFADGHDRLAAVLAHRPPGEESWREVPLEPLGNDEWRASFALERLGRHEYRVLAWLDRFATWKDELAKKAEAGQDVSSELLEGGAHVRAAIDRAPAAESGRARPFHAALISADLPMAERVRTALDPALGAFMARFDPRQDLAESRPTLEVVVDPPLARFGSWYELFPRSCAPEPGRHGTFRDLEAKLPDLSAMGIDVLYLPPIHPVGTTFRKGKNNRLHAEPGEPGSPWGIGSPEGGHTAVHPALGTIDDFDRLVRAAESRGIKIALDIAFQCSPDHPWVLEHPEWFKHRPDGTIKYAENPPKKYQDIYPINFETDAWQSLWEALRGVFAFWIGHGVTVFRVDNPHTKAFPFWEWCIGSLKRDHPEAIFLAEAFTRPKPMKWLAKCGFTQSYTYFTWRNGKEELEEYFRELTQTEAAEYFRPNLFANTPDILHAYLQEGGPGAFRARLILAATLGATYGIYGPPFDRCIGTPLHPGSEEYLDSEKYEVRYWREPGAVDLTPLVARINRIRRDFPALQHNDRLRFHRTSNDRLICYDKMAPDGSHAILTVVNLDPREPQEGQVWVPPWDFGHSAGSTFEVRDLLTGHRYWWSGEWHYIRLDPAAAPAHVFEVRCGG